MIHITDLHHNRLEIQDLTLPEGLTVLSGENGAGKTTLLKLCAGILLPEKGTILISGKPPRNTEIGYVSEFPDRHLIFPAVRSEIASPLRFMKRHPEDISHAVQKISDELGITHLLDRDSRTLSGGEKMLAGLAAALIPEPEVLILDEPDAHLDPETTDRILRLIQNSEVPHILWSSHTTAVQRAAGTLLEMARQ
jgi:energy-coupling factor transporter ATP-binding protein EcfA2